MKIQIVKEHNKHSILTIYSELEIKINEDVLIMDVEIQDSNNGKSVLYFVESNKTNIWNSLNSYEQSEIENIVDNYFK